MQLSEQTITDRPMGEVTPELIALVEAGQIHWQRITGTPKFDYHIDYSLAFLRADADSGKVEFLSKWAPNSYCHYHKHLGPTSSWVIQGEHHVIEDTETQRVHKTRRPGARGSSPAGEVHWEYGGPEGAIALFLVEAIDGKLSELLAKDGRVLAVNTLDEVITGALLPASN